MPRWGTGKGAETLQLFLSLSHTGAEREAVESRAVRRAQLKRDGTR